MVRENGYIVLDDALKEMGVDTTSLETIMKSDKITVVDEGNSDVFSFEYDNKNIYFKTNPMTNEYNHYAELLAEEFAKDYGIPCASYDLAKVCGHKGVKSIDFKKENATYIELADIVEKYHDDFWDDFNLVGIWNDLNDYYGYRDDREEVVANLMSQIVDKFIFDLLICQFDSSNMQIMECDGKVSLAPIFDNEYMQYEDYEFDFNFGVDGNLAPVDKKRALSAFNRFLSISSREYVNKVVDKMWIIGEENVEKKFDIIERKTKYPIPDNIKNKFIIRFANYREKLIKILNRYIDVPIIENKREKR